MTICYAILPLQLTPVPRLSLNRACKGGHNVGSGHLTNRNKTVSGGSSWWPRLTHHCPLYSRIRKRFIDVNSEGSHLITAWWACGCEPGCRGAAISEEVRAGGQGAFHNLSQILALGQPQSTLVEPGCSGT